MCVCLCMYMTIIIVLYNNSDLRQEYIRNLEKITKNKIVFILCLLSCPKPCVWNHSFNSITNINK